MKEIDQYLMIIYSELEPPSSWICLIQFANLTWAAFGSHKLQMIIETIIKKTSINYLYINIF
jgi:hypothetical protein